MTEVLKWKIFCITENKFVEGYLPVGTDCTVCFNNNTHQINPLSISSSEKIKTSQSFINTQEPGETKGNFQVMRKELITSTNSSITKQITLFPYKINILGFNADISPDNIGDRFELVMYPNTPIGVISSALVPGNTVIQLDVFSINYLNCGYYLKLIKNGVTEETSEIVNINLSNSTVTLALGITGTYSVGDYFSFIIYRLKNYKMNVSYNYNTGNYLRAAPFPANLIAELRYTNNGNITIPKNFTYGVEILY